MLKKLAESHLTLHKFEIGRHTRFFCLGMGVNDVDISNFVCIRNLKDHETATLGGSDHRPVTFEKSNLIQLLKDFSRWNIRKLAQPAIKSRYTAVLEEKRLIVQKK